MIKEFFSNFFVKRYSLYLGLVTVICLGTLFAVLTYTSAKKVSNFIVEKYYITEEKHMERELAYLNSLQDYCKANNLSSEDTDKIERWTRENRYVSLMIYKDDELYFSSSEGNDTSGDGGGAGSSQGADSTPEEISHLYELELSDGVVLASANEFTEYFYLDFARITSLGLAILVPAIFLVLYVSRIIGRIKRLETDVAIVSGGRLSHKISYGGRDEIATLSENVEIMRNSILEKLEMERAARDANTELITSMSHDIRTPLTILLGYLDMMKNHEGCDEVLRGYITASENTAMRLKHLSDDMFKYSLAFGDSKTEVNLEEYDAVTLLSQLFAEHILLMEEGGFDFKYNDITDKVAGKMVYTDAPNLMRIIDNIFSNISKYADKEYPVELDMEVTSKSLIMKFKNRISHNASEVESNGIGLKTCEKLSRSIAESFSSGEENGYFATRLALKLK